MRPQTLIEQSSPVRAPGDWRRHSLPIADRMSSATFFRNQAPSGREKERSDPEHEWLTKQLETADKLPIRFVLQVGLLERGPTPGNGPSILETNRRLRSVLERKGYELHYIEIAGGHEPLNWRGGISEGLLQLIGTR